MAHIHDNQTLMIGADPELLVIDPATLLPISAGYRWDGSHGNISRDSGDYETAEIRPSPGSPRQVTENIGHIIRQSMKPGSSYSDMLLVSGGGALYNKAVGGHIHFNVHFARPGISEGTPDYNADKTRVLKVFDNFLGIPLKAMDGGARLGDSYGTLSGCRTKTYGFEYRTPPSWLPDPALTESVLSVAYLLIDLMVKDSQFNRETLASFEDYRALVPAPGPFNRYWNTQVENFLDFVFGGFKLDTLDMRERWNAPALIEWKRGGVMVNMLGAFQEKIERAKAAAEAARIEQARLNAERDARLLLERQERELRERAAQAASEELARARLANLATENRIFNALGPVQTFGTSKIGVRSFGANVFIHTCIPGQSYFNRVGTIDHQTLNLRVGALRIIEHDGNYGWHNFRIAARSPSRRPWATRSVSPRENVIYISNDLKPLVKRSRQSLFKIKFVDFFRGSDPAIRTVLFSKGQQWGISQVLDLFRSSTRYRVPTGFYGPETPAPTVAPELVPF